MRNWDSLYKLALSGDSSQYRDCGTLDLLLPTMRKIDALIGLKSIKNRLAERIMFHCQEGKLPPAYTRFNHMILMGPPGCGKTTLAHYIAELFNVMGHLKSNKVVIGTRQNMIGSFLGHTAKATQAVIDEALGGVLLLDEAYALGDGRGDTANDSFSKSCIDTLNQNLSEKAGEFICIIVGYEDSLQRDFFSINPGLERRFPWRYTIEAYLPDELYDIFVGLCGIMNFVIDKPPVIRDFFRRHHSKFRHFAASVRELVDKLSVVLCTIAFGEPAIPRISLSHMESSIGQWSRAPGNNPIPGMYV